MPAKPFPDAIEPGPSQLDPDRFAPVNRKRLSAPAMRTFLAIADLWGLTEAERLRVLGHVSRSTYHGWARLAREHRELTLDADCLTRLSMILGIHQALTILFASEREGIAWLRGPHHGQVFGGQAPLTLVTSGPQDGLMTVRRFLDGARGGLYMEPNAVDVDFQPYTDDQIALA